LLERVGCDGGLPDVFLGVVPPVRRLGCSFELVETVY
jgi:hypothetical protein